MKKYSLAISAACLTVLTAPVVHAQSSYAMTALSTPASSYGFAATDMDNNGKVTGFQQMRDGTKYGGGTDLGTALICFFGCAAYTTQMVTWPAGTGSSVSASRGTTYFLPVAANEQGSAVGFTVRLVVGKVTVQAPVTPVRLSNQYANMFSGRTTRNNLINGVEDSLYDFQAYGLTANSTVYGGKPNANFAAEADPYPNVTLPTVRINKVTTRTPVPDPYTTGYYTAMNNVGDAAGRVSVNRAAGYVSVIWQAGNLSLIDMPAAYEPMVINNSRQVLLQAPDGEAKAAVWFNGAATEINGNGKRVYATDMNSSGTVVGCTQNVVATPTRADNTAFIWKNGVLQDLSQVLTSKGVRFPSGTRLGCPVAINDSGSILAFYYRTSSPNTVTWVRFTARP